MAAVPRALLGCLLGLMTPCRRLCQQHGFLHSLLICLKCEPFHGNLTWQ